MPLSQNNIFLTMSANFSSSHDFDKSQVKNAHEEIEGYLSETSTYNSFNSGFAHHISRRNRNLKLKFIFSIEATPRFTGTSR